MEYFLVWQQEIESYSIPNYNSVIFQIVPPCGNSHNSRCSLHGLQILRSNTNKSYSPNEL